MKFKRNIFYLSLILCVLSSCSSPTEVIIDNPTDQKIKVRINDDMEFEIRPFGHKKTTISQGVSKVFLNDKEVGAINTFSQNKYLLNPTQSKYYLEQLNYGTKGTGELLKNMDPKYKEIYDAFPMSIISIDDIPYIGNVKIDSNLQIMEIWSYDVYQDPPETIMGANFGATIKVKIYRDYAMAAKVKERYKELTASKKVKFQEQNQK